MITFCATTQKKHSGGLNFPRFNHKHRGNVILKNIKRSFTFPDEIAKVWFLDILRGSRAELQGHAHKCYDL